MERFEPTAKLDGAQFNLLQEVLERFELDCARGGTKSIRDYLPASDGPFRMAVLEELVRTDLEMRWRQRKGVLLEHYFAEFPELRVQASLMQLVEDEYRLRQRYGDKPRIADFQARFPQLSEQLAVLTEEGRSNPLVKAPGKKILETPQPSPIPMPPTDDSSQILPTHASQFRKVRRLGKGAFGEVWEAIGPGGVPVAVKRIFGAVSASAVRRERASLDLICGGKLRHPFLLQVFGWWIEEERLHIAMELADGTVEELLKQARAEGRQGMGVDELRQLFSDAADSLDFLNFERNILHRDVKPANMLLMARRLKLCDFGLARMTENLMLAAGRTRGAGTPVFIAPEIVIGYQSPYSDQYSLAASYYMLRTGKPIFSGKVEAIREQHVNATPHLEDSILSPGEQSVLMKALSKAPEQRFSSSIEFINELFVGVANPLRKSGPVKIQADWNKALDVAKTEMIASKTPSPDNLAAAVANREILGAAATTPSSAQTKLRSREEPRDLPRHETKKELETSIPEIDTLPPDSGVIGKSNRKAAPTSPQHRPVGPVERPTMPISAEMLGVPVPKPSIRMHQNQQPSNQNGQKADLKPPPRKIEVKHPAASPGGEADDPADKTLEIEHPFEKGKKIKKPAVAPPPKSPFPTPPKIKKSDSGGSIRPLKPTRGTALDRLQQQRQQDQLWRREKQQESQLNANKIMVIGIVAVFVLAVILVAVFAL